MKKQTIYSLRKKIKILEAKIGELQSAENERLYNSSACLTPTARERAMGLQMDSCRKNEKFLASIIVTLNKLIDKQR